MRKLTLIAVLALLVVLMTSLASAQYYEYDDEELYEVQAAQVYVVRSGDCLSVIAQRFGISLANLRKWNNICSTCDLITVGQRLYVSDPGSSPTPTPTPTPSGDSSQSKFDMSINYQQCDSRWRNVPIASGGTICSIGCLITSITNSIRARGKTIAGQTATPNLFVSKAGFTSGGAFYHGTVSNVCSGCSYVDSYGAVSIDTVKSWFARDLTVVAGINGWGHYVSVWKVSGSGNSYTLYIRDPAGRESSIPSSRVNGFKVYKI